MSDCPDFGDEALLLRGDVKKALAYIEANHAKTLESQVTIAEIPAPTFHEAERAKYLASEFRRLGLANVEIWPLIWTFPSRRASTRKSARMARAATAPA